MFIEQNITGERRGWIEVVCGSMFSGKTEASDSKVTAQFVERHLTIGIESLKQLINNGQTVRHLQF
jgi:thymidine kinase